MEGEESRPGLWACAVAGLWVTGEIGHRRQWPGSNFQPPAPGATGPAPSFPPQRASWSLVRQGLRQRCHFPVRLPSLCSSSAHRASGQDIGSCREGTPWLQASGLSTLRSSSRPRGRGAAGRGCGPGAGLVVIVLGEGCELPPLLVCGARCEPTTRPGGMQTAIPGFPGSRSWPRG